MNPPLASARSRRTVLVALGASISALAGCSGTDDEPASAVPTDSERAFPTVQRTMGESYETRSGFSVTVRNPRLRKAVVVDQHMSPVQMAPDLQWVVVDVATAGGTGKNRYLGGQFGALTDGSPEAGRSAPLRPAYHPPETGRPVGVPVGVAAAERAAVAWIRGLPRSVVWPLPDEVTASLATAPSFGVETVEISDETDPQVTLTVRNDGERDGTFYANVSGSQVQDGNVVVGVAVPAGETVTHRERPGITAPSGEATRVVVDWGTDEAALVVSPA